jgi:hypothetical protein
MKKISFILPAIGILVLGCGSGDLGNTGITTEQNEKIMQDQEKQIADNPNIPPQAKAMIQSRINMGKQGGGGSAAPAPGTK